MSLSSLKGLTPATVNFGSDALPPVCIQGSTFYCPLTIKDTNGDPVSLANCTARMQVKAAVGDEESLIDLTSDGADGRITIEDGSATGLVELEIDAEDTADLTPTSTAVYDLELADDSDPVIVVKLIRGIFPVIAEVTTIPVPEP